MRTCPTCGDRPPRCEECLVAALDSARGTARARGCRWAESVAARLHTPPDRWPAWPAFDGRARELATRKVSDLARDDRELLELLAAELHREAARWWGLHELWWRAR